MKRVLLPVLILGGCFSVAFALIRHPASVEETALEVTPVSVRVLEVGLDSVQLMVGSRGKVQAARTASMSAPVAGPVAWISPSMESGGYVEAGESLLRIDDADYQTALARSRASLQQAAAEAEFARQELTRLRELADDRLASESQLQDAERRLEVNNALRANAEAGLRQATLDLERTDIRAPFNAIIERREVELGQYLTRAQSVGVLYGADEVEVRLPLAIRQIAYLDVPLGHRGQLAPEQAPAVTLTGFYGDEEHHWQGQLVRIEASIDANSNTVQTIIRVRQPDASRAGPVAEPNPIPLPIGLFVRADIRGRTVDDIISLPRSVIRNNNQVLVVDPENKMYFREVEIFRLEEDQVLISGGLLPGERICLSPIQAVVEGMAVQPVLEVH